MGSTSKIPKKAYLQPGALARGRGKILRNLGSLRITAEQGTLIGKSGNCNAAASIMKELARKKKVHLNMKSFIKWEKRTYVRMSHDKNLRVTLQNELARENRFVPLGFDPMEDVPPSREVEAMQDAQRSEISPYESEKVKKVSGNNICKDVAKLKPGEKSDPLPQSSFWAAAHFFLEAHGFISS